MIRRNNLGVIRAVLAQETADLLARGERKSAYVVAESTDNVLNRATDAGRLPGVVAVRISNRVHSEPPSVESARDATMLELGVPARGVISAAAGRLARIPREPGDLLGIWGGSRMPRLTEVSLEALTESDVGRTFYDDAGLRGEVRRGDESIVVAFSFRYRFDGKMRELRCGSWPRTTLKQIRAARDSHSMQKQ